jgi:hypothetical protein
MANGLASTAFLAAPVVSSFVGSNTLFKSTNDRLFKSKNIAFKAPCNISERHSDDYVVTEHPTEFGVLISDHMYALPQRVDIEVAYSVSGNNYALKKIGAAIGFNDAPMTLHEYYDKFLMLQASRSPFNITTGKRQYTNMVITNITETTDSNTENLLRLNIQCKQIIIVKSYVTADAQKDAPSTATPVNKGTTSLKATNL